MVGRSVIHSAREWNPIIPSKPAWSHIGVRIDLTWVFSGASYAPVAHSPPPTTDATSDGELASRAASYGPQTSRARDVDRGTTTTTMLTTRVTAMHATGVHARVNAKTKTTTMKSAMGRTCARHAVVVRAKPDRKLDGPILRQNEKEGAWLSEAEKEGQNPLKDPMALIGIGGITVPFIILLVANAAGLIGQ